MPRGHGRGSRNQHVPQTCVTIASPRHPDLDTCGRHWTDLDPMTVSCGGDAGTRTRTGVSPSDFKSSAVLASRAREGRFYPLLQLTCVTIARGWHPCLWITRTIRPCVIPNDRCARWGGCTWLRSQSARVRCRPGLCTLRARSRQAKRRTRARAPPRSPLVVINHQSTEGHRPTQYTNRGHLARGN